MFCPKCFKSNPDYNEKCDYCGCQLDTNVYTDVDLDIDTPANTDVDYSIDYSFYSKSAAESIQKGTKKRTGLFALVIIICVIGVFFLYKNKQNEAVSRYVSIVKTGVFNNYSDRSIGEAFDSYFADASWSEFRSSDSRNIVEFTGRCMYGSVEGTMEIQFEIYSDDSFEVVYAEFNNDSLSFLEINDVLKTVMTD